MTEAKLDPILFKRILEELNIKVDGSMLMHSINKSVIEWATGDKPPGNRSKRVDVSAQYIRDLIENNGFIAP
jgi:hypothetical protein